MPEAIEFRLAAVLERVRDDGPAVLPAAALHCPRLLRPTRLTVPDDRLRAMAAALAAPSGDSEETAERVCKAVFAAMTYENGATTVSTTAAAALARGRGVCQDYAHVMLALCHVLRLPARYVSGHLLGQGSTHAWTEVIVPRDGQAEAVAFDPCHGWLRRLELGSETVLATMAAAPTAAMSPSPPAATTPTSPPPPAPTSAPPGPPHRRPPRRRPVRRLIPPRECAPPGTA